MHSRVSARATGSTTAQEPSSGTFVHGWSTANIAGDLFGGFTAAVVALPLALAFGVAAGLLNSKMHLMAACEGHTETLRLTLKLP